MSSKEKIVPYREQLASPKWQKKRLKILERDEFRCKICGDDETELHVHHKKYIKGKKAYEAPDEDLETVCYHCHSFLTIFSKDKQTVDFEIVQIQYVWYFNDKYPLHTDHSVYYNVFCRHKFVDDFFIIPCIYDTIEMEFVQLPFIFQEALTSFFNKMQSCTTNGNI